MDLSRYVVLDCTSGTFFNAAHAVLLDVDQLTPEQHDTLNEGSDLERCDLAETIGQDLEHWSPPAEREALDIIARTLSGTEWTADMFNAIADLVRATGRPVADL